MFIRDVARIEASLKLESLRSMAKVQFPDVEIEDIGLALDYCVFPPSFQVFARRECILARQSERDGTSGADVEFMSSTREHLGEKMRRMNKNITQMEVKVRRGEDNICRHYAVLKFWEGLGCEDTEFEMPAELQRAEQYLRDPVGNDGSVVEVEYVIELK